MVLNNFFCITKRWRWYGERQQMFGYKSNLPQQAKKSEVKSQKGVILTVVS